MNGDVAVERADFVAGLGHIGRPDGVEHHVAFHVDVAAVVHDAPARRIDHGAIADRGGLGIFVDAGAMEVHGVAAARIQARCGPLASA